MMYLDGMYFQRNTDRSGIMYDSGNASSDKLYIIGCAVVGDPTRAVSESRDVAKAQP